MMLDEFFAVELGDREEGGGRRTWTRNQESLHTVPRPFVKCGDNFSVEAALIGVNGKAHEMGLFGRSPLNDHSKSANIF